MSSRDAVAPSRDHACADLCEARMFTGVGFDFRNRLGQGRCDAIKDGAYHGRRADLTCLSESLELRPRWPPRRPIEAQSHRIGRKIGGRRDDIIDRRESNGAVDIVVENAEVLQMRVAVSKRAVERDQLE